MFTGMFTGMFIVELPCAPSAALRAAFHEVLDDLPPEPFIMRAAAAETPPRQPRRWLRAKGRECSGRTWWGWSGRPPS